MVSEKEWKELREKIDEDPTILEKELGTSFKSGFVAIVGRPNVGKSTLLNMILGTKVSITSNRPQTTRFKILGIKNFHNAQIIFIDTPGLHKPEHKLGEFIMEEATSGIDDADILLFMIDASKGFTSGDKKVYDLYIKKFQEKGKPVFLILNKIDLVSKDDILELLDNISKEYKFDEYFPISALKNDNIDSLLFTIIDYLPDNVKYYSDGEITNVPLRLMIAEIIREKVLRKTYEEIPHSVAVRVVSMRPGEKNPEVFVIDAEILVERDNQKKILIGKNGRMIKEIGRLAREELEVLLNQKVYLNLEVKVEKDWRNRDSVIKNLGYEVS